jgi:putative ATP-dependent endonuclease of OLD family
MVTRQLDGIVTDRLSVALFATRVLLVEGETEAAVFYGIGDRDSVGNLESQGLSIVSANGKGGIHLVHAILTSLGIPTYVLFDGDSGFESRFRAMDKDQKIIKDERTKLSKENRLLLKYLGETEVDFPLENVGDHLATLSDHLESYLESNWAEWGMAYTVIETAAGIKLPKNQYAYRTATREATGIVPETLKKILTKAGGS